MKVGDLVRQKFSSAEQTANPWLKGKGHTGVVIKTNHHTKSRNPMICVHWFINGHKGWYGEHRLEVVNENR